MYLLIKQTQYPVTRRRVTSDSVIYTGVTTEPEVSGVIQMYSNEDFLFSEDNVSDYLRHTYEGNTLTLTNLPEPEPQHEPEPVEPEWHATQAQMDAAVKLASRSVMTMSLTADETIEVYISRLRQDASVENGFSFWSAADNLRFGVAGNAYKIMEKWLGKN